MATTIGELIERGVISRKTPVIGELPLTKDGVLAMHGAWVYGTVIQGQGRKVVVGPVSIYTTGVGCSPMRELFATPEGAQDTIPDPVD